MIFTLLPIIFYGIYDKSYPKANLMFSPSLYYKGLKFHDFNKKLLLKILLESLVYSIFITFASLSLFDIGSFLNGYTFGYWSFTNQCFFGIVLFNNISVILFSWSYSTFIWVINFISTFFYMGVWFWSSNQTSSVIYQTF